MAAARGRLVTSTPERAPTEAAMRRSEATFRAVFNGLPDAAILTGEDRRIRLVNPAFETQFGITSAEVAGGMMESLYADPLGAAARVPGFADAGGLGPPAICEVCCRRRDGTVFWAESTVLRVAGDDGATLGIFAVYRNITRRKQAEQALRRSREQLSIFID